MPAKNVFISYQSRQTLSVLGANIDLARKRRKLRIKDVASRAGITEQTYQRLKKGDPGVGIGVLVSVLQVLNLADQLEQVAAPEQDETGLFLAKSELDQKKRIKLGVIDEPSTDF